MKANKKALLNQREYIDEQSREWLESRGLYNPPTGWVKALRMSLGLTTRQLAERTGVSQHSIINLEKSEQKKTVSLSTLVRVAEAMNCELVYALVPKKPFNSLDDIVTARAQDVARQIVGRVGHSMRLEKQGVRNAQSNAQIKELASQLKENLDSRLWDKSLKAKPKKSK